MNSGMWCVAHKVERNVLGGAYNRILITKVLILSPLSLILPNFGKIPTFI